MVLESPAKPDMLVTQEFKTIKLGHEHAPSSAGSFMQTTSSRLHYAEKQSALIYARQVLPWGNKVLQTCWTTCRILLTCALDAVCFIQTFNGSSSRFKPSTPATNPPQKAMGSCIGK